MIALDEVRHFRPRTKEETEETKRMLGNRAEEHMKQEDKERERFQNEYNELRQSRGQINPVVIYFSD
jgi:hypothetical protein